jgi:methylmalonyl-CoA mutase N-terminal domain/subunit
VRAGRSADACRTALEQVEIAARDGRNLVPPIITAVDAKATAGEIADVLRRVFGEFEETAAV